MNLNNEYRYGVAPTTTAPRSTFSMHQNIRTTFNAGQLIPFYVDSDIMPGDTFKIKGTFVVRQSTPIYPTMDNSFLDVAFFFVPHRLVWDHWVNFWGENETGVWAPSTTYQVPQIIVGQTGTSALNEKGDILQYMGIPIQNASSTNGYQINALPYRAYVKVVNDWWRDENVCPPLALYTGDSNCYIQPDSTATQWGDAYDSTNWTNLCKKTAPVFKYKDAMNSLLPQPQKGAPVTLPLGTTAIVDIFGSGKSLRLTDGTTDFELRGDTAAGDLGLSGVTNPTTPGTTATAVTYPNTTIGVSTNQNLDIGLTGIADLSNAVAATINAQRFAFAAQRILEMKARAGSRYFEIIDAFFSTHASSARLQRSEFLGSKRIPITMNQVAQTSSTDSTSPQGNVSAFSLTVDSDQIVHKSFVEHGTILGVLAVRQEHSYDSGIAKMWQRKNILDFYHPQLAFLGEEAVTNETIYATGEAQDKQTLGYNERWWDLRAKMNINTGAFSTRYAQSLSAWHYGDSYNSLPVLSFAWRKETKDFIDRTLAVQSSVEDQYLMDCRLDMVATRPLPMYGIPGLLDHF